MKKVFLFLAFILGATSTFAQKYQLENSDYENWGSNYEPTMWHTYSSAGGTFGGMVKNNNQSKRKEDARPGSTGKYSAMVSAGSAFGIISNGMLTTGQIEGNAMSATDPKNHNITQIPNYASPFIGRPDSVVAWLKTGPIVQDQSARFYFLFHNKSNTQDPGTDWTQVVAAAGTNVPYQKDWQRVSTPVFYKYYDEKLVITNFNGKDIEETKIPSCTEERPSYCLASIATNFRAGKGTKGDSLLVDDLVMIYNSKLSSLKINGTSVAGFNKDQYTYNVDVLYKNATIDATSDGKFATIEKSFDEATNVLTLTVKGDDYSESGNSHVYTVQFKEEVILDCSTVLTDFSINGKSVTGFSSDKKSYTFAETYAASTITYKYDECATATENWNASSNILTITLKANEGYKGDDNVYTFQFHEAYGSSLSELKINGTMIKGFSPITYNYSSNLYYEDCTITYKADAEATVTESYDKSTQVYSLVVKGGDFASNPSNTHTYVIQFPNAYGSLLKTLQLNGVALSQFSSIQFNYQVPNTYNASTTVTYTADDKAVATGKYDEATNSYIIRVEGGDYASNPENFHQYTIQFHEAYGSQLKSLSIKDVLIESFAPDKYEYTIANAYDPTLITYVTDEEATASVTYDSKNYSVTIIVKGGDFKENSENTHTYKVQFHAPYESLLTSLQINGTPIAGFNSLTSKYSVKDTYTDESAITYTYSEDATASQKYDATTNTLTITIEGGDILTNPSNKHVYAIEFHDSYGSQLTTLQNNHIELEGFASDVYSYLINGTKEEANLSWEVDNDATYTENFDESKNLLTIVVKGGDYASNPSNTHTYTVQFCAPSVLTSLKIDGTMIGNFRESRYNYSLPSSSYENVAVTYTASTGATVVKEYDPETSLLTLTVKGKDIEVFPTNFHVYTVQFHTAFTSFLSDLSVNGTTIEGFNKNQFNYTVEDAYSNVKITQTPDAEAKAKVSFNDATNILTITVSGGDIDENPTNQHVYKVQFYAPSQLTSLRANGSSVSGFAPNNYNYSLGSKSYEDTRITFVADDGATTEQSFDSESNVLTITVKGKDIATFPKNFHQYKIQFSQPFTSFLSELKVDGALINGFEKELFQYQSNLFYKDVVVSAIADDERAYVKSQYNEANQTLTIRVEAGNITTVPSNYHVYTVQFSDPTVYTSQLKSLEINGTPYASFDKDSYQYNLDGSYADLNISYTADDKATVVEDFDEASNKLTLTIKGGNIDKDPSNYHTYVIGFTSKFSYGSQITSIHINGKECESFDKDTYTYTLADEYTTNVEVAVNALAQYCTYFDEEKKTLTVVVWAGDFASNAENFHSYTFLFK